MFHYNIFKNPRWIWDRNLCPCRGPDSNSPWSCETRVKDMTPVAQESGDCFSPLKSRGGAEVWLWWVDIKGVLLAHIPPHNGLLLSSPPPGCNFVSESEKLRREVSRDYFENIFVLPMWLKCMLFYIYTYLRRDGNLSYKILVLMRQVNYMKEVNHQFSNSRPTWKRIFLISVVTANSWPYGHLYSTLCVNFLINIPFYGFLKDFLIKLLSGFKKMFRNNLV